MPFKFACAVVSFGVALAAASSAMSAPRINPMCNGALGCARQIDVGAVPEPATWAMMIAGFGLVGVMARRRARLA
jgi:hypothetical protein